MHCAAGGVCINERLAHWGLKITTVRPGFKDLGCKDVRDTVRLGYKDVQYHDVSSRYNPNILTLKTALII